MDWITVTLYILNTRRVCMTPFPSVHSLLPPTALSDVLLILTTDGTFLMHTRYTHTGLRKLLICMHGLPGSHVDWKTRCGWNTTASITALFLMTWTGASGPMILKTPYSPVCQQYRLHPDTLTGK